MMNMLFSLSVVIFHNLYVDQNIKLYILNIYIPICQLYLLKT